MFEVEVLATAAACGISPPGEGGGAFFIFFYL
jgi:hypothetical protein